MSLAQRLRRLEEAEWDQWMYREAERLAAQDGRSVDGVLRELEESGERIARWGIDAELRLIAQERGVSEDEVRADYEAARAELEREP